ncbi:MAG: PIG-L deacetylase family protein [Candidatus Odinarchaeota archaeon]
MTETGPKRAMVIMAHPDDPEFFSGGTIALWAREGAEIIYLILSNGNKGSDDPAMTPERLAELRQEEQRSAANLLGVKTIIFLGEPDGELQATLRLRQRVVREIRRHRPDIVICPDPTAYYFGNTYVNHPDHRAAGQVALEAIFPAARNRMYHPELLDEGLMPHAVREMYLAGALQPDRWVDITDVMDLKIQAIQSHASQLADPEGAIGRVRQRAEAVDEYGRPVYREAFRYLTLR